MTPSPSMRLSENFYLWEFEFSETAIRHDMENRVPVSLMPNVRYLAHWLQTFRNRLHLRDGIERPISITSGFRSVELNRLVRGSPTSAHMQALAADFRVVGLSVEETQRAIWQLMSKDYPYDQVIDEFEGWVHVGLKHLSKAQDSRGELLAARRRRTFYGKIKAYYRPVVFR